MMLILIAKLLHVGYKNFFNQHDVFYVVGVGEHVYRLGGFAFIAVFSEKFQVTGLGFRIAGNVNDFFRLYFTAKRT